MPMKAAFALAMLVFLPTSQRVAAAMDPEQYLSALVDRSADRATTSSSSPSASGSRSIRFRPTSAPGGSIRRCRKKRTSGC
jgi:hypothetical protein